MEKIKVVIADDEQLICSLLKEIILWDKLDLELIDVVYNGKMLYDSIKENKPEIVILDICMPEMDGLELIKMIREEGIPCKFIIVSGYRQFEYAQNALKYDVEDYILKPIDNEELNGTLEKLVNDVRNQADRNAKNQVKLNEAKQKLVKLFLTNGIFELEKRPRNLNEIKEEFGVGLSEGLFQMLHVKIDIQEGVDCYTEDISSVQKKLASIFQKKLGPLCMNIISDIAVTRIRIGLNYTEENKKLITDGLSECFKYAQNIVGMFKGLKLTVGVARAYRHPEDLAKSEREAQATIWSRLTYGVETVIFFEKMPEGIEMNEDQKNKLVMRIKRDFEILDADDYQLCIEELFSKLNSDFGIIGIIQIISLIIEAFFNIQNDAIAKYSNESYIKKQLMHEMDNAITIREIKEAVSKPIISAIAQISNGIKKSNIKPVRQTIDFIKENYRAQIRLEDAANAVNFTPGYLSSIFKKETGENFTDYLTNYRMSVAKELLRNSNQNINEIANLVGYVEPRYFSKLFKKMVGLKPSDYRRIYG